MRYRSGRICGFSQPFRIAQLCKGGKMGKKKVTSEYPREPPLPDEERGEIGHHDGDQVPVHAGTEAFLPAAEGEPEERTLGHRGKGLGFTARSHFARLSFPRDARVVSHANGDL